MTKLTQDQIAEAMAVADAERRRQCEDIAASMQAVADKIDAMRTSVFGGVQLWSGGLPRDLNDIASQMTFLAQTKVPMVAPPAAAEG